jgi:hypothetical protein
LDVVADCPSALTTVSVTVYVLAREKRWTGVTPEPLVPSPKSHVNVPLDSDDEALKNTSSSTTGSVGENVKFADPAGRLADTVMGLEVVADSPVSAVTRRVIVNVPPRAYRCVTGAPAPVPPSPKSHAKLAPTTVPPPGPGKPPPWPLLLKTTSWLIAGLVGENVKFAVVAGNVADAVIVLDDVDVALVSLVTLRVMVNVPGREYRCVTVPPMSVCPSPKSQANVPLLTVEEEPLKETS